MKIKNSAHFMVTMVTANILEMVNIAEAPTHCGDGFSD
jgi:hypothetical protein